MGWFSAIDAAHWKKGDQMRYKAIFIAGVAVGFVAGARAGRGAYNKMVGYGQQVAGHPKVQQATTAAQAKATEMAKTAAAKAPDYAKSAATSAAKTAQAQASQVPKYVSSARQAAASKIPARFGGAAGTDAPTDSDPAADGTVTSGRDDIAPDGNLIYPADGGSASVNGTRYTPDNP
ncbi:MAG: hypothetical protein ACRDOI_31030 [Trebonia sp.]